MKIESLKNERVKNWIKLHQKKYRDETNLFLIEEDHLINEALKKDIVNTIIICDVRNLLITYLKYYDQYHK